MMAHRVLLSSETNLTLTCLTGDFMPTVSLNRHALLLESKLVGLFQILGLHVAGV